MLCVINGSKLGRNDQEMHDVYTPGFITHTSLFKTSDITESWVQYKVDFYNTAIMLNIDTLYTI